MCEPTEQPAQTVREGLEHADAVLEQLGAALGSALGALDDDAEG